MSPRAPHELAHTWYLHDDETLMQTILPDDTWTPLIENEGQKIIKNDDDDGFQM
jgi:hypothetical protein